ncbi:hypothetical protein T440DRAFT_523363 [Plenodomus tracheiphilus IPT5]|uniref:Uncharacterized protein n=1 Tax=Plenodomus tracheiphilus IPT5 TaxID=1408161 RepID=A0A6A7AQI7_9PLEO|nr:hypothetical protein T440DRAFT_523363 [Plenodomus tracheiphilus IPT5]
MSDVLHLLVAGSSAVIGGVTAYRFGLLWGAVAAEAVLVAKYKYGVQLGLDHELTKISTALYMLMDLALTLDNLTVREPSVVGASVSMAAQLRQYLEHLNELIHGIFLGQITVIWPYADEACYYWDVEAGCTQLTSLFENHITNLDNWTLEAKLRAVTESGGTQICGGRQQRVSKFLELAHFIVRKRLL